MCLLHLLVSLFFTSTSLITEISIPQLLGRIREQVMFTSLFLLQTFLACVLQFAGIGSAGLFFFYAFPLFISLTLNALFTHSGEISLWTLILPLAHRFGHRVLSRSWCSLSSLWASQLPYFPSDRSSTTCIRNDYLSFITKM